MTRAIASAGGTANQVTVLRGDWLGRRRWTDLPVSRRRRWPLLLVGPWLFVRMALNAIDGMLAREHGQKSALGGILNELDGRRLGCRALSSVCVRDRLQRPALVVLSCSSRH